jgi:hypothetical protein
VRKEGLEWNFGWPLQPREQHVSADCAELGGKGGGGKRALARLETMKPPEPLVDPIHEYAGRPAA